jgi:GntR family transcriptional regulator
MHLHLNTGDGVPIYLQIVNQVKYLIASGRLAPGEELTPIRVLAEQLLINPNTVARAYRELERAGVVEKHSTTGTFVSATGSPLPLGERLALLAGRVDSLLVEARQMNVNLDDLVDLVRQRATSLQPSTQEEPEA